ncbi:MAG: aminoacyl-tRNA hydrolase [Rhodobiaceae bacterium]|nr:aminoacyl-tRNA hydrolase [Rhodobiaceae bacterium]MCC0015315.1 aminoacyl-tRNA hydrolase [Rhodobiaceae bacterium]MCC0042511.1 aminoacyl-tRNA hydrolase [Rhodobiaceae bacterium]MCC0053446.1 aminoacyl-tRNA hydrolase [Rhodobiaceae bacterium]
MAQTGTLLVGLGNPGARYAGNRHNVGFMAVEAIAARHRLPPWRKRFLGAFTDGPVNGGRAYVLLPGTYMNESGNAVAQAMNYFRLTPADVVVFHDELDLAPGKVRVKTGGGAAGNNGIRSIIAHIGAEFRRVRIGIGHPGHKNAVQPWVLGDFSKGEREWLAPLLDAIADNADRLVAGDDSNFMNRVALATGSQDG